MNPTTILPGKGASSTLPTCASEALRNVGILAFLESDPRPTFLVDITQTAVEDSTLVYWNLAFAAVDSQNLLRALLDANVVSADLVEDLAEFKRWISDNDQQDRSPISFCGHTWRKFLVKDRWLAVNGTQNDQNTLTVNGRSKKRRSRNNTSTFDWTCDPPPIKISPHVQWARSIDWASTSLGPMTGWSSQLRNMANFIMRDPRPAVLFWGTDLIMLYNEAYIPLLGGLHPCMGRSAAVALVEVWSRHFGPIIEANLAGETVEKTNTSIHLVRSHFIEEAYFSFSFIPIFDSNGATVGHYEPLVETTREVVAERRARALLRLSEEVPRARDSDSYWELATEVLSLNDKDILFALLYSVEYETGSESNSGLARYSENHQVYVLRGSFGLPGGSPAAPERLDIGHGFAPYFRQAMLARNPIMVNLEGSPVAELYRDIDWKGYGDPCRGIAICPLNPTSSKDNILGYMVFALNPRRPYDDDYRQFIMVTSRLLSTSLTSILLHEEEIYRRERAITDAESMKRELKEQLLATQKEVERSADKFQRFAERADIGIFIVNLAGEYSYRNDAWFHILDPGARDSDMRLGAAWDTLIDDEYREMGKAKFEQLVKTKQHQSFELRLKRKWTVPGEEPDDLNSNQQPMWVLLSVFPELSDDGEVLEIVGCFLDISRQKWGEKIQATQAEYACESKRQLESFIDTTSHEMRNPLSAIVQSADSIILAHSTFDKSAELLPVHRSVVDTTIDAAETIVQCSKHMKSIVDDVLTMSKLDSGLFVMTPVDVQSQSIARDAVKMFEGGARAAGVGLEFRVDDSCKQSGVDYVSLDPTRVLQILINLITNAIKFTRLENTRHISVSLAVSLEKPVQSVDGLVSFIRSPEAEESRTLQADWEKGDLVYIIFSVQDTGRGLSDAEHELLFARFSQASPRTHIDYGGSGLGLFISRRLTEMHGGAIGFASQAKVGSTFSFYVKCRKSVSSSQNVDAAANAANISIRTTVSTLSNRARDRKDSLPILGRQLSEDRSAASKLNVLIVEDNLVNQRVLSKQLRNHGMNVAVANHGGEALDYLRTTDYVVSDSTATSLSLILMDWEMPVMDGLTCVREIRKLQVQGVVRRHVPVIAVTANVREEQVAEALKAGMDDVISKPFRIPELCACIYKTIGRTVGT
ncbi:hypothetical protein CC80DRAFT_475815 [Byssothecium circinans]|uniref:Aerobic respiration control sensor protein arcB n=1 Tax=Byssothecium circinans TaxID=147558 RepID=A0A6A5TNU2_9PLEO|nr:hypothetical protein CC80DRAFT_475815 [Byssothecium circinans]